MGTYYPGDGYWHAFLYEAENTTYSIYDFTCYYNNGSGDYYTGYVYAPTGYKGYQYGYTQSFTDETGKMGIIRLTGSEIWAVMAARQGRST